MHHIIPGLGINYSIPRSYICLFVYLYIYIYVQLNIRIHMWILYHTVLIRFWLSLAQFHGPLGFEDTVFFGLPLCHFEFGSVLDAEAAVSITVFFFRKSMYELEMHPAFCWRARECIFSWWFNRYHLRMLFFWNLQCSETAFFWKCLNGFAWKRLKPLGLQSGRPVPLLP